MALDGRTCPARAYRVRCIRCQMRIRTSVHGRPVHRPRRRRNALCAASNTTPYEWTKDGAPISGATTATYTPTTNGSYTCVASASNWIGDGSAPSNAITVSGIPSSDGPSTPKAEVSITSAKVNPGTSITTDVRVNSGGVISLTGVRLRGSTASGQVCTASAKAAAAGTVMLRCTFNAATRAVLRTHSLRVRLRIVFQPHSGASATTTRIVRVGRRPASVPVTG